MAWEGRGRRNRMSHPRHVCAMFLELGIEIESLDGACGGSRRASGGRALKGKIPIPEGVSSRILKNEGSDCRGGCPPRATL